MRKNEQKIPQILFLYIYKAFFCSNGTNFSCQEDGPWAVNADLRFGQKSKKLLPLFIYFHYLLIIKGSPLGLWRPWLSFESTQKWLVLRPFFHLIFTDCYPTRVYLKYCRPFSLISWWVLHFWPKKQLSKIFGKLTIFPHIHRFSVP